MININCKNNGNINKTFIATYKMSNGEISHFIFQKINTTVFKEPYKLMKNIENVTKFIELKTKFLGDIKHPCLRVIKNKNNTPKRYKTFLDDIELDVCDRANEVSKEIVFAIKNAGKVDTITQLLESGKIPYRVTHNDTKVNNVMMDKNTGNYLTVIDLDTVMKGSLLYDYGDGVRSTASNSAEDETDLDKVFLNLDLF